MKSIAFGSCTPNWDIRAVLRFEQPSRQKPSIFAESAQVPGQALAFKFRHSLLEGVGRMPFDLDAVEVFFNGDFDLEVGKVLFWSARAPGAGAADRNLSPGICS